MQQPNFTKEELIHDSLRTVNIKNKGFIIWISFLSIAFLVCLYAYSIQLKKGLVVTGMRDYVSWGIYISNFVFFVACSLIGMLISSVLGLIGFKWIIPITRVAEIIAVGFAMVAGIVVINDMGRPDRLQYVIIYGRFQSPILWDITVVTTYIAISVLLYFLPLIPDLAICKNKIKYMPKWVQKLYNILSLYWIGSPEQASLMRRLISILLVLIVPVALSIHTVTSWLFAVTMRTGWNSTLFGPYFVIGAFVAGCAAVIIAMYFFRVNYKLEKYFTNELFDKMSKLMVLVSLVYLYFNINEFLVPGYKMDRSDSVHLHELFTGTYALMFWFVQIFCLILPIILMIFKPFRKPLPAMIISLFVITGSWFKRYIIVIPTMENPFLPIQHVPLNFVHYHPTMIEIAVNTASMILVLIIITVLSKLFPIIPIHEILEHQENQEK